MQRTYRSTLGPNPPELSQVEPEPKRAAKLTRLIQKHIHEPIRLHGCAPGAVDLMGLLRSVHDLYGCLTRPMVEYLSGVCALYTGDVYATASFYSDIFLDPKGEHHLKVCTGTTCHVKGASQLVKACRKALGVAPGETDEDGRYTFFTVACVGACSLAPLMMVDTDLHGNLAAADVAALLDAEREAPTP